MSESPALNLLLHAALQEKAESIAFIGAMAHPRLASLKQQTKPCSLHQSFKPYILDLLDMGLHVQPPLTLNTTTGFELVLVLPSKDKTQSLGWLATAFQHLAENGKVMMACENQYGAKSYETALKQLAGHANSGSKAKCRLATAKRTEALNTSLQTKWLENAAPQIIETHGLWAQAGLFSWKVADVGSSLLLEHLPKLSGEVMDLCCGYGLLASGITKKDNDINMLYLVEADSLALDCAQKNLSHFPNKQSYHLDAAREILPKYMDVVVCNPPFHTGQTRDVELGQRIIQQACEALKHGGELFMVANRQLPYEKILKEYLSDVACLVAKDGFKVLRGKK